MAKEDTLGAVALASLEATSGEEKKPIEPPTSEEPPKPAKREMTPEEVEASIEERAAKLAQVLDRGILNDKLQRLVDECTPKGRRGKLVRDNVDDITRYANLGFTFDIKPGSKGMHASADGRVRAGDLVLMTISEDNYAVLRRVKRNKVQKAIAAGRSDYASNTQRSAPGISVYDESTTHIG